MKPIAVTGIPMIPVFMAPSVTPWRYKNPKKTGAAHNPGIRLVKYDRATGNIFPAVNVAVYTSNTRPTINFEFFFNAYVQK